MIDRKFFHEMKQFHNHIGIVCDGDTLVRLTGVGEDDMDVYYHVQYKGNNKCSFPTAVGAFESLKGKIERYDILERMFSINGCPPTKHFTYTRLSDYIPYITNK